MRKSHCSWLQVFAPSLVHFHRKGSSHTPEQKGWESPTYGHCFRSSHPTHSVCFFSDIRQMQSTRKISLLNSKQERCIQLQLWISSYTLGVDKFYFPKPVLTYPYSLLIFVSSDTSNVSHTLCQLEWPKLRWESETSHGGHNDVWTSLLPPFKSWQGPRACLLRKDARQLTPNQWHRPSRYICLKEVHETHTIFCNYRINNINFRLATLQLFVFFLW